MAYNLKEVMANKPSRLTAGHRMCAGCGAPPIARMVLRALKPEDKAVISNATGCMEVSTFLYPYTAWTDSYIHTAFECAAATASGAEAAYKSLKKQGKLPENQEVKFITFGGDGGTYDIGLQSLSGAMERGHDMVYVCYDNGAYMNTGIQRSSATPRFADTTTSPAGSVIPGKMQSRKDLTEIMVSHHIPYVGQTIAVNNFKDLYEKSEKAIYTKGPAFLNVLSPCPRGWGYPTDMLMQINKLAVETCYWPLYEVVDGKYKITYKPAKKLPIEEFLKPQKRFKHMFKPGNEWMIEEFQKEVDKRWDELLKLEKEIAIAKIAIERAYEKMKNEITPKFTKNLSNIVDKISNGKYNKIKFVDGEGLIVELENGEYVNANKLSIGTIDELYLSLRLSAIEEITREKMPIILDEAFAYFDNQRLENILEFINNNLTENQVIIFTCSNREKDILNKQNIKYNYIEI